jgi:phage tail-like protein
MPRAVNTDFYQAFRFAVALDQVAASYIETNAGFNNITIPEISEEAAEYREGSFTWTQKYPGVPTVSDATFQQGVSSVGAGGNGRPFMNWIMAAINGGEYRSTVTIYHLHRTQGDVDSREIVLEEAFPMRVKPDGDLDATSSEVSIREMDVACESVQVNVKSP